MPAHRSQLRTIRAGIATGVMLAFAAGCASGPAGTPAKMSFPGPAGINYGEPRTADGGWVGTQWLRSGTGRADYWPLVRAVFERDLQRIEGDGLGRVLRIFIGLDQLMIWDPAQGYAGFNESGLENFGQALDMVDAHHMRVIAVLYDQEEVGSVGNFHFQALDGAHAAMRAAYVRATADFLKRFGDRATVIGWDLFNEAYNSLGSDGDLRAPPAADPVSPNYTRAVVHAFLKDLYTAAKQSAPGAWFTVSDTTELYWHRTPNLSIYAGVLDFYDIHVYDDHPSYPNWRQILNKPYMVGEAGASVAGAHYDDQKVDPPVLRYLLENAHAAGVQAVLAHGKLISPSGNLTPTGQVVAAFVAKGPGFQP